MSFLKLTYWFAVFAVVSLYATCTAEEITATQVSAAATFPNSGDLGDESITVGSATFSSTGTENPKRNLGWEVSTGPFNPDFIGIQGGGRDGETGDLGVEQLTISFKNGAIVNQLTLGRQGNNDVRVDISGFSSDPGATFSVVDPAETDIYELNYDQPSGTLSVFSREGGVPTGNGLGFIASYNLDFSNEVAVTSLKLSSPALNSGAGGVGFAKIDFIPATVKKQWTFVSSPDFFNSDIADLSGGADPAIANQFDASYPNNIVAAVGWEPGGVNSITPNMVGAYNQLLADMQNNANGTDVFIVAGDLINGRWPQNAVGLQKMFGGNTTEAAIDNAAEVYYKWYQELFRQNGFNTIIAAIGDHDIGDNNWPPGSPRAIYAATMKQAFGANMVDTLNLPPTWNGISSRAPEVSPVSQHDEGSFAIQINNVLFLTIDVFRQITSAATLHPQYGTVDADVQGDALNPNTHLGWINAILEAADNDPDVDHVIVQAHTPILSGVRKFVSSGMMFRDREDSDLWQVLREHGPRNGGKVRLYFAGEVHTTTATLDTVSDIVHLVHGDPPLGIGFASYAVFSVTENSIGIDHYDVDLQRNGGQFWQVSQGLIGGPGGADPGIINGSLNITNMGLSTDFQTTGILNFVRDRGLLINMGFDETIGAQYSNTGSLGDIVYAGNVNGAPSVTNGIVGDALNFDGVDDFVRTDGQSPMIEGEQRTVAAWINADVDANSDSRSILGFGKINAVLDRFILQLESGTGRLRLNTRNGSNVVADSSPPLNDGLWHHVAMIMTAPRDNLFSDVVFYIDGVHTAASTSDPGYMIYTHGSTDTEVTIGAARQNFAFWKGSLDDVSLWGRSLNSAEVLSLRNAALEPSLNYGTVEMDLLFELFNSSNLSTMVGGDEWFTTSGLPGVPGDLLDVPGGFAFILDGLGNGVTNALLIGDVNRDGVVNLLDVAPFVDLLASGEYQIEADINQDGIVNLLDVDPFIQLLSGN